MFGFSKRLGSPERRMFLGYRYRNVGFSEPKIWGWLQYEMECNGLKIMMP